MKLRNQLLQLLIGTIIFVIAMMVCLFYKEKDYYYYQKQLRQETWENTHYSIFDNELLKHYGIYYDVTEDISDSLINIYH